MNNIVVVGGGTAGWLTALYIKRVLPEKNVTVIESKDIGVLGAGEGATPHLVSLLDFLGVPVSDLVKNCDATIKNGIKFTNWNNNNDFYYHSFLPLENLGFDGIPINQQALSTYSLPLSSLYLTKKLDSVDFNNKISEMKKVGFQKTQIKNTEDPILQYRRISNFSVHFNAIKLAKRLTEIGLSKGIELIDGVIEDIVLDKNNNIKYLILQNGKKIKSDFVFDATGFHRLIIGKKFESKWHSHSDHLPVDSALPFFIKMDKEIPPYTESIAMKYGWMWKIPLQSRYGCGYVFDSSLISEKEAAKEIEEYLGFEPEYPRKDKGSFKFKAGYYEDPWTNNCIAVGLASGFIEPLEATSIWITILSLQKVLSNVETLFVNTKEIREDYNKYFRLISDQVVDFIYFHYMSKRSDTEFWKKFTYSNAPINLKNKLETWQTRLPSFSDDLNYSIWGMFNWLSVASGINHINLDMVKKANMFSNAQKYGLEGYRSYVSYQDNIASSCVGHNEFLEDLNGI